MNSFFIFLLLLSVVILVIGLIKPTLLKLSTRSQTLKIVLPAILILFVLIAVTTDKKPAEVKIMTVEEKIQSAVEDVNLVELSFGTITKNTNSVTNQESSTVLLNVKNLYSKDQFFKQTGKLNSKIFQVLFTENPKLSYVTIQFQGEKLDQFGKTTTGNFLVETLDKTTYDKIVWENFDTSTLCDFLRRNNKNDKGEVVNACGVFVGDLR